MPDVLFYHLENQPLERVLPILLEKTLERGWRAVIEVGSSQRAEALDTALWTFRDDSFLAHGLAGGEYLSIYDDLGKRIASCTPQGYVVQSCVVVEGLPQICSQCSGISTLKYD